MKPMKPEKKQKIDEDTIMEFPCQFPIKAMGKAEDDFDILVVTIIRNHVTDLSESAVKTRLSKEGKFVSVTVTVEAESRQQLDNIYLELTVHEKVLWAL